MVTEEQWAFTAASGEHMEIALKYERGTARRGGSETRFFSGKDPAIYQTFKVEQGLDIMRNATITVPDKVKEFSYKASGGRIGALFDGTERVLSIDTCRGTRARSAIGPRDIHQSLNDISGRRKRRRAVLLVLESEPFHDRSTPRIAESARC